MPTNHKPRKSYDPLADHLARGRIDQAQFRAGREFQRHFGMAKKGQLAPHPEQPEPFTDDQSNAGKWLTKIYKVLGADGSAVVHDVLIRNLTARQIAESRGKTGPQWEKFFSMRLRECLRTLAAIYGFANVQIDRTNETAHAITGPLNYSAASRA